MWSTLRALFSSKPLANWVSIVCAFVTITITSNVAAEAQTLVRLPHSSEAYPELKKQLETSFQKHNLDGLRVELADYWHSYVQSIRRGKPGLYLAEPHLASWAIRHHNFVPIIQIKGELRYVLVARRSDTTIFEIHDLNNKTICAERPLSLNSLWLSGFFTDYPAISYELKTVDSSIAALKYDQLSCDAFSINDHLFTLLEKRLPNRFIRIQQSRKYTNPSLIADTKTAEKIGTTLKNYILSDAGFADMKPVFERYVKDPDLVEFQADDEQELLGQLEIYWGKAGTR